MSETRPRILYVDDDEALCSLAARALRRRGYDVTTAHGGVAGVECAKADAFDLITVDHYMPGQDGLATLKQLRALPAPPPVIYVTGSDESSVAVAALKAGAADYVVKTVGDEFFDLLANSFDQALDQVRLRTAKESAEAELRASNERLQAMLREVNHRVSNSLQLVTAFVQMQANALRDPAAKAALNDTQTRIKAIGQVHRSLYSNDDVGRVAMDDYLSALIADLEEASSTPEAPRRLKLSCDPVSLKTDQAVSLGVIVNELVSNACKYAYGPDQPGEVRVALATGEDGSFRLIVEDDGCGLDPDKPAQGTGLGRKLVQAMAKSLRAKLDHDPDHRGVRAVLTVARA